MDNMYVIGYRIDVTVPQPLAPSPAQEDDDLDKKASEAGLSIDCFPGAEWMHWPSSESNTISVWQMKGKFAVDYRCPIDRAELWQEMHNKPFDAPVTYAQDVAEIQSSNMFRWLTTKYGTAKVKVYWGIALMLG